MSVQLKDDKILLISGSAATDGGCCCGGVCCDCSGTCTTGGTQEECEADGGTWISAETTCAEDTCDAVPTGACCEGLDCSIKTESCCNFDGGSYQGDDTICDEDTCSETGACCHLDGSCSITTPEACDGSYQGNDTTCEESCGGFGSCCYDIDTCGGHVTCVNTSAESCADTYAGVYSGNGTTCFNGCECLEHLPCTSCFECTGEDSCFAAENVRDCCEGGAGCLLCSDGGECRTLAECGQRVSCYFSSGICVEDIDALQCACEVAAHTSLCGGCPDP